MRVVFRLFSFLVISGAKSPSRSVNPPKSASRHFYSTSPDSWNLHSVHPESGGELQQKLAMANNRSPSISVFIQGETGAKEQSGLRRWREQCPGDQDADHLARKVEQLRQ